MIGLPEITSLPARHFLGLATPFRLGPAHPTEAHERIAAAWQHFFMRIHEITTREPGVCYGLTYPPASADLRSAQTADAYTYVAAVAVNPDHAPLDGLLACTTPAGLYAKFTYHGSIQGLPGAFAFIYQTWLPRSPYRRGPGPDWEWYDRAFRPSSPRNLLEIYLPPAPR